MKHFATVPLIGLLATVACSDHGPTAPAPELTDASAVSLQASMSMLEGQSLDFTADLDNIVEAILPGFSDVQARDALKSHIDALKVHLAAGDRAAAAEVLSLARAVIVTDVSNRTDLGYIEMVFGIIDAALLN